MLTNQRTVTVKMTRGELCRLLLVCDICASNKANSEEHRANWQAFHDKLREQLDAFDAAHKDDPK